MGMMKPSLDELLGKVDSKYTLVVAAAKRARQLMMEDLLSPRRVEMEDSEKSVISGHTGQGENRSNSRPKPVRLALEEMARGELKYEYTKSGIK